MTNVNKVALNSLALYANMGVTMLATLLGTRFVLQALGKEEFGIYALIASLVALFSFLNIAMAAATQRYLSFSIGEGEEGQLREIFYGSVLIHWGIAAVVGLILLTGGYYAVTNVLDIAPSLSGAAQMVLLCVTAGLVMTINAVPYEATMNAHEDMVAVAMVNIVEAILKLGASIAVLWLTSYRLECYAFFILCAQTFAFLAKRFYSRSHYVEVHFTIHRPENSALLRNMLSFAGWNLIGTGCNMARYQGTAVLLNLFFGLVVNAAYGVAQQVNGFLVFFAGSVVRPLRPQLIKSEGAGQHERMLELAFTTSRVTFLMMAIVVIPLYINMPCVLGLWLPAVPEGTVAFCRGFLLIVLINQATVGLNLALESVGRIRLVQMVCGTLHCVALPVGYALFRLGFPAVSIMYCIVVEELVCIVLRIWVTQRDAMVPQLRCYRDMLLPEVLLFALSFVPVWLLSTQMESGPAQLLLTSALGLLLLAACSLIFYLSDWEKAKLHALLAGVWKRVGRKHS